MKSNPIFASSIIIIFIFSAGCIGTKVKPSIQVKEEQKGSILQEVQKDTTVTHFINVQSYYAYQTSATGGYYQVTLIDTNSQQVWKSPLVKSLANDLYSYLLKVNVPKQFNESIQEFWCSKVIIRNKDTVIQQVGGARPGGIKLNIVSQPKNVEVYLITKRYWDQKIGERQWQNKISLLEDWKVNTSNTDTYAMVDESVFVIVFKRNNIVKKINYRTIPLAIKKEQEVSTIF